VSIFTTKYEPILAKIAELGEQNLANALRALSEQAEAFPMIMFVGWEEKEVSYPLAFLRGGVECS